MYCLSSQHICCFFSFPKEQISKFKCEINVGLETRDQVCLLNLVLVVDWKIKNNYVPFLVNSPPSI